jgi:hypothetical protein
VAGAYPFVITISDSSSIPQILVVRYRLVVAAVPLTITTNKLTGTIIESTYNLVMGAAGGTAPYTWEMASGLLPPGITLSPTGTLAGTATESGSFPISIKVTDSSPRPETATMTYKLVVAPESLLVATTALPGAATGSPYVASLAASGGTAPFTWQIVSGHLPAGITMTSAGNLSGDPTGVPGFRCNLL